MPTPAPCPFPIIVGDRRAPDDPPAATADPVRVDTPELWRLIDSALPSGRRYVGFLDQEALFD